MTSANELLSTVRSRGVEIWAEQGKLRLRGPKDALPAGLMESLANRKAEILRLLEIDATRLELPLSQAQLAVWQAYRSAPQSPAYNVNTVLELQADYQHAVLEHAFERVVARHAGLRCVFAERGDGSVIQRVQPAGPIAIERRQTSDAPGEQQAAVAAVIDRPFRLEEETALRVVVVRTPAGRNDLVVVLHHVASDFWGSGILIEEVTRAYAALSRSEEPQFDTAQTSLQESIEREAARARDPTYRAALERGLAIVADETLALDLPADLPRPRRRRMSGATLGVTLDPALTVQLRAAARAHEVTAYTLMLTAFVNLLARAARQARFRIGIPVAGRTHAGEHALVGNFVNLVPLIAETHPDLDVAGNLQRMHRAVLNSIEAQVVPFMDLVQHGSQARSSAHGAFFDVVFNWNKFTAPPANAQLVRDYVRGSSTGVAGATHDLALSIVEHEAHFSCVWNYDTDLYGADSIGSLAKLYVQLLRALLDEPRRCLRQVPLLPEGALAATLAPMRAAPAITAGVAPIRAFEARAAERPQAVAVRDAAGELSYAELDRRANLLAQHLVARGARPEKVVALCLERGVEFTVAMLGIAKSGAAYLPIDASEPPARIAALCAAAGAAMLVSATTCVDLPQAGGPEFVFVDLIDPGAQCGQPRVELQAENLAYVIFTSGSTGMPKGVMVTQRGLASLVDWHREAFGTGPDCIATQMAKVGFDACVLEMWPVLCAGGTVCVVPARILESPARIPAYLAAQRVTWSFITTALYESIAADAWALCPSSARIAVGGDILHSYRDPAVRRLDNFYGPTEITVLATAGAVGESGAALPGIGRPIPGADVLALDDERRPVPIGWVGELYLAGPGLARGYINDPRRTAEAFTPHPCPRTAGQRAYRSGDLGRYRAADGELAFCGRADRQLKLRGFRVEPGEIEQCLRSHAQVREARTLVVGRDEHRRLVCFCTGDLTAEAARDWLRARLPAYMVPARIDVLERMPTNANGKIDLTALAARAQGERRRRVAAATPTEEQMLAVWREVLASDVDVEDEFFESGGNSLLAARLAEQIRAVTGKEIALVDVLEYQTVRALARALDTRPRAQAQASLLAAQSTVAASGARFEPFPLTDVQHAYWVGRSGGFELGNVATHIYTESDSDSFDVEGSNEAWNQLIERHDMLRAVFSADGQQRVLPRVPAYRMPVDDLSALDETERNRRLMETRARMSHQVFDPQQWPLFEFRLSISGPRRVRLHGSFDALIADAHSFALLAREFEQIKAGKRDSLAPLGITFRDYVLAERQLRSGAAYIKAREYWLARADDFPTEPQLPLARDPGRIEQPRFARLRTRLEAPDWTLLKERARRLHVTPSVLLLGVYAQVLSKWSGSARFVLNLTLFNRMPVHPHIGNVVGDFTSLTAFEVRPGGRTFAERLVNHQAQLWRDLEHRAFSAVELLRELRRRRGSEPVRMPVVFTSVLPLESGDGDPRATAAAADYSITQTPQVWLDHVVQELEGALLVHWDFVEELFPAGLMPAMFAAYECLLRDLASDAACWDAPDPVALPAAQRSARDVFNDTRHLQPAGLRIFDGFLASAQRAPAAVAVIAPERTITYGELHAAAHDVAAQLLDAGVRRGDRVAVIMHKGWEQVVAAVGATLAGAAYLPIDASLPEARRLRLIAAAGVRVALVQARDLPALSPREDLRVLPVDGTVRRTAVALPEVGERDLAYVIFTSGSTGTPKGVMIDHRGAVNTILDINRRFALEATDRLLALSSLSFDLSVWDVFGALAAGAALVIPAEGEVTNPQRWSQHLRAQAVTVISAVPAFLQMLADFLETQTTRDVGPLRLVMMSGDWIPVTLPGRLRALAPACHIESLGGATEVSIWSVSHTIEPADAQRRSIPYGRPLLNQRLHVLDEDFAQCPDWVSGMLYIAGDGLALGYWGDPKKTAQSFIPDPAGTGARLYRTGDFARHLPEGVLEFLGRRDDQVKVQGHRIELAEIEAALLTHPAVREAAVQPQGSGTGRALYAYVVGADGLRGSAGAAVRGALDYLPESAAGDAAQPVIADPLERLQFKFSQRGLRRFGDASAVPLRDLPAVLTVGAGAGAPRPPDLHALGSVLSAFRGWKLDGPLPKYFYPSAGSLYPVQVYLRVPPSSVPGLDGGTYYFHPLENALWRTGDVPPDCGAVELHLVADLEAIAPMYGTLAAGFCEVEAGGMAALLEHCAGTSGLHWHELPSDRAGLAQSCRLTPSHRLLKSFVCAGRARQEVRGAGAIDASPPFDLPLLARQSFREFHGGKVSRQQIERMLPGCSAAAWLHVQPGAVADLAGGLYRIADAGRSLEMIVGGPVAIEPAFVGDNAPVFAAAAFAVLFAADSALDAGVNAGRMQLRAAGSELGLCTIGYVDQRALAAAAPPLAHVRINHALLGGAVSAEQRARRIPVEKPDPRRALAQELEAHLKSKLPEYMVPRGFIFLDRLPLSTNGKLDRKALPLPVEDTVRRFQPPQGELEQSIAAIWCDVLAVERVGREESFFSLGGNSMLLIQMYQRLRGILPVEIAVTDLFTHVTVAALAAHAMSRAAAPGVDDSAALEERAARRNAGLARRREGLSQSGATQ